MKKSKKGNVKEVIEKSPTSDEGVVDAIDTQEQEEQYPRNDGQESISEGNKEVAERTEVAAKQPFISGSKPSLGSDLLSRPASSVVARA